MSFCIISADNKFDCSSVVAKGIYTPSIVVYNWADWKAATLTEGADGQITEVVNDTGKEGYEISTDKASNIVANSVMRKVANGINGWDQSVVIPATQIGAAAIKDLKNLNWGKFVVVIFLKQGIGIVYGHNVGLELQNWQENLGAGDVGSQVLITLGTNTDEPPDIEPRKVVDATTFALTETLIFTTMVTAGV